MHEETRNNTGVKHEMPGYGVLYTIYRHGYGLSHEEADIKIKRLYDKQIPKYLSAKLDN